MNCQQCGTEFQPVVKRQRFCSATCGRNFHNGLRKERGRKPMPESVKHDTYAYAGYVIQPGIDLDDYLDFEDRSLFWLSVKATLNMGNLPPGLLLECRGVVYRVYGSYGHRQYLVRQ